MNFWDFSSKKWLEDFARAIFLIDFRKNFESNFPIRIRSLIRLNSFFMLSQHLQQLVHKGVQSGFFKALQSSSITDHPLPLLVHYGPLASNLFFHFRHQWIQSFIRHNCGRYNFLWLDSIDQITPTANMTIGWQTKSTNNHTQPPLIFQRENQTEDDYFCIRYIQPIADINLIRLADERTRFWKKYFSHREKLECLSVKQNQFNISYRLGSDFEPYHLETIQNNNGASLDLSLNVNHTLISLLLDAQMKYLHPLLPAHQIAIESTSKTTELSLYLSKLLTYKHHLRVLHLIDTQPDDYIPYHLILDENSLKNGLCLLRNRDTRLDEQMHVKQVAKSLADYFQALEDVV